MFGKIEAAKKAIADGANVNAKKDDGETPLHWATVEAMDSGSKKVIELLIENGADVNAKIVDGRKKGMTPLAIANMFSNKEIADLLSKHGGKTGEELKAAGKTTEPVAEASQTKPATAKALDISIRRALFDGNIEAVKKHLASGADLNVKTKPTLSTPLHSAVMRNRIEMAELLITAGCEVNAKDFKGYTPLDIAIRRVRKPMADLLRKHGGKTGEELKAEGK
jgi:ankyrin repeat protein